jgi:hypothetical protein
MSGKSPLGNSRESGSYEGTIAQFPVSGFTVIKAKTDPGTNKKFPLTSLWVNTVLQTVWIQTAPGSWLGLASGSGNVLTVSGTASEITSSPTSGNVVLSLPAAIVAPGSLTTTTSLTATLGAITATNGNLVLGTAGNKIISSSVASTTAAGANSFGTVTLVGGTATVSTTAVTASSIIMLTRQSVGATGAAALGMLSKGTVIAGTSFVINSLSSSDATVLAATDVSSIGWMIIN